MNFKKYMHIERLSSPETAGILEGECYIFPKLDGSNGVVWFEDGDVQCGSRNRHLTNDQADNNGFADYIHSQQKFRDFFKKYPNMRLYGEWLVPHSLRTYRDDAWRKFYVFDVFSEHEEHYGWLPYYEYTNYLARYDIDFIPAYAKLYEPTEDDINKVVDANYYLLKDDSGVGEGIVIKRYDFINQYGRTCWAKIVRQEFKDKSLKTPHCPDFMVKQDVELRIANNFVTLSLINKEIAKISNDMNGWRSEYIQRLFQTVFYCIVKEDMWDIVKKYKYPQISFKKLMEMTVREIKIKKPELF